MSLFSFRTRSPQRDREIDRDRFDRLFRLLNALKAEIDDERDGLLTRYREAQDSAAFALQVYENGEGEELSTKADELALAMQRFRARIAALEMQAAYMQKAEADARALWVTPSSDAAKAAEAG